MAWIFTLIFITAGQPPVTFPPEAFAGRQACEAARLEILAELPAAQATPCTLERVRPGTPISR